MRAPCPSRVALAVAALALSACTGMPGPGPGAIEDTVALRIGDITVAAPRVASLETRRRAGIFMQEHDYSCGAASLATLLHFHFGEAVDEAGMLTHVRLLFGEEARRRIERDGMSFSELETVTRALGYRAASVRLSPASLAELRSPVIVYLERGDYRHFAVLKGVSGRRVLLADPSRGNVALGLGEFVRDWDGRTFVVGREGNPVAASAALAIDPALALDNARLSARRALGTLPITPTRALARTPRHPSSR